MNCPLQGVKILEEDLNEIYQEAGVPNHFKQVITTGGHLETIHMRTEWKNFLQENL